MAEKKFQYVSPDRPYGDPRQPYLFILGVFQILVLYQVDTLCGEILDVSDGDLRGAIRRERPRDDRRATRAASLRDASERQDAQETSRERS